MNEQNSLPHTLTRIAERPNILHWHSQQILSDNEDCAQLARPLFDAGVAIAAITQRCNYDSELHWVGIYRFTLLLRGSMRVQFGDEEHSLSPGQIACVPPGSLFRRRAEGSTWWIYFDIFKHKIWQPIKKHGPHIRRHPCPDLVFILLQHLIDLHENVAKSRSPSEKSKRLEESIPQGIEYAYMLLSILRQECAALRKAPETQVDRLHALVQQIRLAPQRDWNVDIMCHHIHASKSSLRRLMMQEYGVAPMQLVIQARLDEAILWLKRPENTVLSIAQHVGYESVYSFTRLFTKHMGMPPGRYRDTVLHAGEHA